jgi:hypothetical protein
MKEQSLFVPNELKLGNDSKWLMEKRIFTKGELLGVNKLIGQEMKR